MQKDFFGTVIHGLGKGKEFGFPTINIKLINNDLDIDKGVYIVRVNIHNQSFNGMLYVGTRPTLELRETSVEIHLLDYNENLYDCQVGFQILQKIRNEIHFESVDQLIKQLHHDRDMVYKYFQNLEGL
jgi:riboflavin kinase/FMN adenylyltransferase